MKEPWIKLWTRETLGSLITMTAAERGAWLSIICTLAESEERGVKTMPTHLWYQACACNQDQFARILKTFRRENSFDIEETEDGMKFTCRRLVREAREMALTNERVKKHYAKNNGSFNADFNGDFNGVLTVQKKEVRSKNTIPPKAPLSGGGDGEDKDSRVEMAPKPTNPSADEVALLRIAKRFTPNAKLPRPPKEVAAWRNLSPKPSDAEIELLEAFYALPKSGRCDETWNRKTTALILLHNWREQVELAERYRDKEPWRFAPREDERPKLPPAPPHWQGALRELYPAADPTTTWEHLNRHYPDIAETIIRHCTESSRSEIPNNCDAQATDAASA